MIILKPNLNVIMMEVRVCQMCQKLEIPLYAVKFLLLTLSYLYIDKKIGNFLMFRGPPNWFSVYFIVY